MLSRLRVPVASACVSALGLVVLAAPHPAPAQAPQLAPERCVLAERPAGASCFRLVVPERHERPDGPKISLAVVVLRARAAQPVPDPVIFFAGGPGEAATTDPGEFATAPLRARRDLVLLDQRGTGRSRPALRCPETDRELPRFFLPAATYDGSRARMLDATRRCRDRLRRAGADLGAYTSMQTAGDVALLRRALGVAQVNLYGVSYGTRAGLAVLRYAPEGIRSAVLDSGSPPDEFETPVTGLARDIREGFRQLEIGCAADRSCRRARPRLGQRIDAVVRSYTRRPWRTRAQLGPWRRPRTIEVTGADLYALVWNAIRDEGLLPSVPALVDRLAARDPEVLRALVLPALEGVTAPGRTFFGAQLSVDCADTGRMRGAADRRLAGDPGRLGLVLLLASGGYCDAWGVPPVPASYNAPVVSDVPSLLVAGGYDPISLPSQTRQMGRRLSRATLLEVPSGGHVPTATNPCAARAVATFLDAPGTLDGCAASLRPPRFR